MRNTALAATLFLMAIGAPLAAIGAPAADIEQNLFISPTGQPYLAPKTDPYPIVLWFAECDTNHDGKIDHDEFIADATRFFALLDRNKDGFIDSSEINIYEHYLVPEILNPSADAGGLIIRVMMQYGPTAGQAPGGGQSMQVDPNGGSADAPAPRQRLNALQGAVQFSLFNEPEPVAAADRNLDGRVSLKEFQTHAERHFTELDFHKRGYITLNDLPATQSEHDAKANRGKGVPVGKY